MALIKTKPTSPGRRFVVKADRSHLHKGGPVAALTSSQKRTGARNNQGRLTTRHKGGGHKHRYRVVDFRRIKDGVPGKVERLEYDPNRNAHVALVLYADGERRYILAPKGVTAGDPIQNAIPELERCVKQLGFVGCLLNPDPYENSGTEAPPLGDRYWYPLYEKLCELDVPAHIHGTGSRSERSPYSVHFINEESIAVFGLVNSNVLNDFPKLKIVVSHGGGAIPYQLGRFEAPSLRRGTGGRFSDGMRKLYYDTVLYTEDALRLLIKTVGVDRCLFGTECPGIGSSVDRPR